AHLHTNFRLDKQGGYLALVTPRTNVVSTFGPTYPPHAADTSYGRVRGEPAICGAFSHPTPGRPNASSGPEFSPKVTFSRPSGNFTEPFTLQLTTVATGAVIRYTLDGTLPTVRSMLYEAPLLISNSVPVRARAYQEGLLPGPPHSEAYLRLATKL